MQLVVFGLLLLAASVRSIDEDVIAQTKYGKIQGVTTYATNQKPIYGFKAIPFAKPPQGQLRFEPPQPVNPTSDSWGDEIRDGTKNPPACAQWITALAQPSEDCLYLNVFTPIKPGTSTAKRPVMVYIYGGANLLGDSVLYAPNRLMAYDDVVLVVLQYRLGALGFLATGDSTVAGNNGYKDQREALRWVQDNIDAFNGDRDQVTLFGESAGAAAALAHLLSPPAKRRLFHKVIAQSGTPVATWAQDTEPAVSAKRYAKEAGCHQETMPEIRDCLKTLEWTTLAKTSFRILVEDIGALKVNFGTIGLVVEPEGTADPFMLRNPLEILKNGDFPHDIPVMLGANQHEGSFILGAAWVLNLDPTGVLENATYIQHELVPKLLDSIEFSDEHFGTPVSQSLANYYYPPDAAKDNFTQITAGLVDMLSVLFFKGPILLTADYLSQVQRFDQHQVYLYSFEREGFNSIWTLAFDLLTALFRVEAPPIKHGVMHADDLMYFWSLPFVITGKDRQFSEMVCKMWINFAVKSNPTPGNCWPKWSPYKTSQPNYYKLDVDPELLVDYTQNWRKGSNQ